MRPSLVGPAGARLVRASEKAAATVRWGGKTDIEMTFSPCPLMTHSGHAMCVPVRYCMHK